MRIFAVHPGASFSTADVYEGIVNGLTEIGVTTGHYQLDTRILAAGGYLRGAWRNAKRQGLDAPEPTPSDILWMASQESIPRALAFEPDLVLVVSAMYFPRQMLKLMQRAGLMVGLLITESPYDDAVAEELLQHADIAWTNERTSASVLSKASGKPVHYLPHAYDPQRHVRGMVDTSAFRTQMDLNGTPVDEVPSHDVVFVGTGFIERVEMLEGVNWEGIDFGLYGGWRLLGSRNRLRTHLQSDEIPNGQAIALYSRAKIGLNLYRTSMGWGRDVPHITSASAESLNPRALELAAMGLFTISDYRMEAAELFGGLVPMVRTSDELERVIRYHLDNPEVRAARAEMLPEIVKDWTFENRARQLVAEAKAHLSGEPALAAAD